jgi:geranylgeranyl pyrophosphate synthase
VAAAWALLYTSAHIFDSVQDADPPDPWWEAVGQGAALNVATGLLTTAWGVLNQLHVPSETRHLVSEDFQATVLRMASGQHLDLTNPIPSLEQAWAVAEAKSGAFFALACRSGARMAGVQEYVANLYGNYGLNLGLIVQMGDDLDDLLSGQSVPPLAVAYCMETASIQERHQLTTVIRNDSADPALQIETVRMLGDRGAALYLATKLEQFQAKAVESLDGAGAEPASTQELVSLILSLVSTVESAPLQG